MTVENTAEAHGLIKDQDVAELRAQIGIERRLREQFHEVASADAIRHFAHGIGDTNPLWLDPAHGAASRFETNIAPPCFLCSCGMPRSIGLRASMPSTPGAHGPFNARFPSANAW